MKRQTLTLTVDRVAWQYGCCAGLALSLCIIPIMTRKVFKVVRWLGCFTITTQSEASEMEQG